MGVWTNGQSISHYHRKDPNYFEDIPTIPHATEKLSDILGERWTIDDLIKKDKLVNERKSLKDLILEMEDEVLANAGVDVFEELFKLIFTKLYDELESGRDKKRYLIFKNYGDTETELKTKIQSLFDKAKKKWDGVFSNDAKIQLTSSHLAVCVASLEKTKLFNSNLDVVDEAFEYLINKSSKGEKGQYFTPRYVIDMCVKMLNPQESENIIDTAAGSCGFPVHAIFHVWAKIIQELELEESHLFTTEKKPPRCEDYVQSKVFAIDFDEKAVRVGRTLNLIAGDGQTNVLHLNTLDYERWNDKTEDKDWLDIYHNGWKKIRELRHSKESNRDFDFDVLMANPPFAGDIKETRILAKYDLGKKPNGKYQTKVGRDILFIERNLNFLKSGGRMAVVLPQGRFNNSSDKYIRDYIAEHCRILAVVGLHGNVFKPHTGTKTSVLFVQKWDDVLCPKADDYPIFFATMQEPSKDNSGDKIYLKQKDLTTWNIQQDNTVSNSTNENDYLLDKHGHLVVKHDLFSHELEHGRKTPDGIAEAFIEFAKKGTIKFFRLSPFNKAKYQALLEGLEVNEILLSETINLNVNNRIDAEYFNKKALETEKKLVQRGAKKLEAISKRIVNFGAYSLCSNIVYRLNGVPYIFAGDIKENIIDLSNVKFIDKGISETLLKKSLVKDNQLLLTIAGTIGNCAVAQGLPIGSNSNQAIANIDLIEGVSPYFVSAFINSKFGKIQTKRQIISNVQPNLLLNQVKQILITIPSTLFQDKIEFAIKNALLKQKEAKEHYTQAKTLLLKELGLDNFTPSTESVNIKSLKESFGTTGRLDAEYYQPKYEEIISCIKSHKNEKLSDLVTIKKSIEPGTSVYSEDGTGLPFLRVADYDKFGVTKPKIKLKTDFVISNNYKINQLKPRKNTIIFSKDGSIGIAYHLCNDAEFVTSSAILHLTIKKQDYILPEYLTLVLNSILTKVQAERDAGGSIILHWRVEEIKNVVIPIIDIDTQILIAGLIQQSFTLKVESKHLLDVAKQAVEIAIEQDEQAAFNFISRKTSEIPSMDDKLSNNSMGHSWDTRESKTAKTHKK